MVPAEAAKSGEPITMEEQQPGSRAGRIQHPFFLLFLILMTAAVALLVPVAGPARAF
jgi:hypothetical protein